MSEEVSNLKTQLSLEKQDRESDQRHHRISMAAAKSMIESRDLQIKAILETNEHICIKNYKLEQVLKEMSGAAYRQYGTQEKIIEMMPTYPWELVFEIVFPAVKK